jgi:hypothetical protein
MKQVVTGGQRLHSRGVYRLTDIIPKHDAMHSNGVYNAVNACTHEESTSMTAIALKQESTCIFTQKDSTGMHALKWSLQCGQRLHSRGVYKQ